MAQSALRCPHKGGQVILIEDEPCTGLYVVESGWLKVEFVLVAKETGESNLKKVVGHVGNLTGNERVTSLVFKDKLQARIWFEKKTPQATPPVTESSEEARI